MHVRCQPTEVYFRELYNTRPKVVYVNTREELTKIIESETANGNAAFRTRTQCGCSHPHNHRDAVIVTYGIRCAIQYIAIRCKACSNQPKKGGNHGTF